MATIPGKIQKFADLEKDAFTTIAQANWQKAAAIMDYVNRSYPVGMLMFFYNTQYKLPALPDSRFWKYCDGTAVNNLNSPLHGVSTPDLRGKFLKHPGTGQVFPATAGADNIDLAHSHGGVTGFASDWDDIRLDAGSDQRTQAFGNHQHGIDADLGVTSTVPVFHEVQVYIRIV